MDIDAFKRDGFVIAAALFNDGEISQISAWADELQSQPETPGRQMMYFEPSALL